MSVQQASTPKVAVSPLELEDAKEPPLILCKPKEPYTTTILSVERIVDPKAPGDTGHIVIDHSVNVPYWEEQSYGVIPPGDPKKLGTPHNVHVYSMASSRMVSAAFSSATLSQETKLRSQALLARLCFCLRTTSHIMIAIGTGVAPFRGYLRRMFMESVPTFKFGGLAWLFLGVANSDSLLYDDEFSKYLQDYPNHFRYDRALSREQKNKNGGKMYVQDKIEEYSDEIFKLLDEGLTYTFVD